MSQIDESIEFVPMRIAVLTVSDSRSLDKDKSGQTLVDRIQAAGHVVAYRSLVKDERSEISKRLHEWISDPAVDAVISTGGTGLTGRDVTLLTHQAVYEK